VKLHGAGFIVTREEARQLGLGNVPGLEEHIREYRNGRDLTASPRDVMVIDLFGLSADDVRQRFPAVYQWLLTRVKPERDENNRQRVRELWWVFAEPRSVMRKTLEGTKRYIATGQVAKHRLFQWLSSDILPDDKLIAIASSDALHLGVLSSAVHAEWALAAGGLLEDRPVYSKSTCFETFPFPADDSGLTPALAERIRALAEHTTDHVRARLPKIYTRELVDVIFEQPYCRIGNLVDKGIAQRQAASRYLHDLASLGVLRETTFGKEKLFIHPKLMQLLSRDNNQFQPYA
jgi:hypothetical protein